MQVVPQMLLQVSQAYKQLKIAIALHFLFATAIFSFLEAWRHPWGSLHLSEAGTGLVKSTETPFGPGSDAIVVITPCSLTGQIGLPWLVGHDPPVCETLLAMISFSWIFEAVKKIYLW